MAANARRTNGSTRVSARPNPKRRHGTSAADVRSVLASLERLGSRRYKEGLARYGIDAPKAFGVPVGKLQALARRLGRDHELAVALWETGWYEARMLAAFVDDPARVTPA